MRRVRLFYGWWIVLTAGLGLLLGAVPIVVFSFGVFLKPLGQEFHFGRAAISLSFTLFTLTGALSNPMAGRLIDQYGARKVILPCTLIFGLVLLSSGLFSGRAWQLYTFYLALGVVAGGTGPLAYSTVVAHWFSRRRGLALGLMMSGLGLGAIIMPLMAGRLIPLFGWRSTYGILGSAVLCVSLPILVIFLKDSPDELHLLPDGLPFAAPAFRILTDQGMNWQDAWRSGTFWLLLGAFFLVSAAVQACLVHLPTILTDRGASTQTAALASSFLGGGLLAGRVGSGYLLDRFSGPRVAAGLFGGAAVGIALLLTGWMMALTFLAASLIGLGLGAEIDVMAYFVSRYFGLRAFGLIFGWALAAFAVAAGIGAFFMGLGFDSTGSYTVPLEAYLVLALAAVAMLTRLGPYRYGVEAAAGQPCRADDRVDIIQATPTGD